MGNVNKVFLMGNLTRDPERRVTPNGATLAKSGLAVNRRWKDKSGQMHDEVLFVDFAIFGVRAENFAKYFHKGDPVFLQGSLRLESWSDATTGQKRNKVTVLVEDWQFLPRQKAAGNGQPGATGQADASTGESRSTPSWEGASPDPFRSEDEPVGAGHRGDDPF